MSNFYNDNPDLMATLRRLDLARVVRLREDDFRQAGDFAYAPKDLEDALDSYERTLAIVGDIAGEFVEPRAEDVDRAGMDQSARILAINSDPGAAIFSVAHYGIAGDLHKVIPLLIQAYRTKA